MPKRQKQSKRHSLGFVREERRHQNELRRKAKKALLGTPKAPRKILSKDPALPSLDPQKAQILRRLMGKENITATDMQKSIAERYAKEIVNYQSELAEAPTVQENDGDRYQREKN